jgi:hypothetical protein
MVPKMKELPVIFFVISANVIPASFRANAAGVAFGFGSADGTGVKDPVTINTHSYRVFPALTSEPHGPGRESPNVPASVF